MKVVKSPAALLGALLTSIMVAGCNSTGSPAGTVGSIKSSGNPTDGGGATGGGGTGGARLGGSCEESSAQCLALKYVVYETEGGAAVVSEAQVATNIAQINSIWKTCGIQFQIDEFVTVLPRDVGLSSGSGAINELSKIRSTFGNDRTLLVVTTQNWGTTKNAWTTLPGYAPYGAVLEARVGDYPNIIAHELGHYLNLDHYDSGSNVMNTVIGNYSTPLNAGQCREAQSAISDYWQAMLR